MNINFVFLFLLADIAIDITVKTLTGKTIILKDMTLDQTIQDVKQRIQDAEGTLGYISRVSVVHRRIIIRVEVGINHMLVFRYPSRQAAVNIFW